MCFNASPRIIIFSPHEKPHGVKGLSKHYYFQLDQIGHGKCVIIQIPCACISCTHMLDKPFVVGSDPYRQPRYQLVEYCMHWPVLGYFNNWNIIKFANKTTTNEDFYKMHKVVLDGISDNMSELVQNGTYGAINTVDPTTMGYHVAKSISEPYTLEYDKKFDKQVIKVGELIVISEYICTIKANTDWYWQ